MGSTGRRKKQRRKCETSFAPMRGVFMWYVIHTVSGMEEKCRQQCERYVGRDDYKEMFIPQHIVQKHFKKEWHEVKKPLFPGYLFVDTGHIEAVMKGLQKVFQYTKVLRDCETVSPITEEEQKFLSAMMDKEHIVHYSEGFLIGDEVVVTKGPLKNLKGYVRTVDRHRRIAKMEVPLFGRLTPMEVGFGAIARVSGEEFRQIVQENIQKQEKEHSTPPAGTIRVLKGIFKGMTGKLLHADESRDEWTVEIELFGAGAEVVFRREEIEFLS